MDLPRIFAIIATVILATLAYYLGGKFEKPFMSFLRRFSSSLKTNSSRRMKPSKSHLSQIALVLFLIYLVRQLTKKSEQKQDFPPLAKALLYIFLSEQDRENILGDLQEEYILKRETLPIRKAIIWAYAQAIMSTWPLIWRAIKLRLFAFFGKWVRHNIS